MTIDPRLNNDMYALFSEILKRKCKGVKYFKQNDGSVIITISPITIGRIKASLKRNRKND